jgi:hypothetical protein
VEEQEAGGGGGAAADPGFTHEQLQKVSQAAALVEERDTEIRKARGRGCSAARACMGTRARRAVARLAAEAAAAAAAHARNAVHVLCVRTRAWPWPCGRACEL